MKNFVLLFVYLQFSSCYGNVNYIAKGDSLLPLTVISNCSTIYEYGTNLNRLKEKLPSEMILILRKDGIGKELANRQIGIYAKNSNLNVFYNVCYLIDGTIKIEKDNNAIFIEIEEWHFNSEKEVKEIAENMDRYFPRVYNYPDASAFFYWRPKNNILYVLYFINESEFINPPNFFVDISKILEEVY